MFNIWVYDRSQILNIIVRDEETLSVPRDSDTHTHTQVNTSTFPEINNPGRAIKQCPCMILKRHAFFELFQCCLTYSKDSKYARLNEVLVAYGTLNFV